MHGPVSEDVHKRFDAWIISQESRHKKTDALYEEWESLSDTNIDIPISAREKERRLSVLHAAMNIPSKRKGVWLPVWALSACAAAVCLLFCLYGFFLREQEPAVRTCLVASANSKGDFTLPDGTRVWLNSGSCIEYDEELFSEKRREVRLDGEAFFDVTSNGTPFVVKMGGIGVKVLGTRFNARNSSLYDDYQVTLVEGKVQILADNLNGVYLRPGQQFTCTKDLRSPTIRSVNPFNYSSWTGEGITFDNMTIEDISVNLEHWYNVRISFSSEVDRNIRISFKLRPEDLSETLSLIEKLTGLKCITSDERNVMITSR